MHIVNSVHITCIRVSECPRVHRFGRGMGGWGAELCFLFSYLVFLAFFLNISFLKTTTKVSVYAISDEICSGDRDCVKSK